VIPSFITDYELIDLAEGTTVFIILFVYLQSLVICTNSAARENVKFAIPTVCHFFVEVVTVICNH